MQVKARAVAAALVVVCAITACTPANEPPPPPSTTVSSPSETQVEREYRLANEGAEQAYRDHDKEYTRLLARGGRFDSTVELRRVTAGPRLKESLGVMRGLRSMKRHTRGSLSVLRVTAQGYNPTSKQVQVESCEDGRQVEMLNAKGKVVGHGFLGTVSATARFVDGQWRVWRTNFEVRPCAG